MADIKALMEEIDALFIAYKWTESYDKLKPFMTEYLAKTAEKDWDKELVVRWARAMYYFGKFNAPKEKKQGLLEEGRELAAKLAKDDFGLGHLWYSVLVDGVSELHGMRARVQTLVTVEEHLRKAADLLPNDPIAQHGMGKFYYELADIPWILKSLVKMVYGGKALPVCTFELALESFLKAESIHPDFYSMNTAYIGRCYVKLKQNEKAIPYLRKAAKWEKKIVDDAEAKQHALDALKHIGVHDI